MVVLTLPGRQVTVSRFSLNLEYNRIGSPLGLARLLVPCVGHSVRHDRYKSLTHFVCGLCIQVLANGEDWSTTCTVLEYHGARGD